MAKYTITIQEIVENEIDIFDFDYPFYNETFRSKFEEQFINHFYFDEIGCETIGRFKHLLKTKLNLIMPYWNKIYESQEMEQRILDNYDVEETFTKTATNNNNGESSSVNKNLFKDTPKTKIDIDKMDIVNSISKDEGKIVNTNIEQGSEQWTRKMSGNIGIQTDSDAIIKWWSSLRKVTEEIFEKELSELFMGVY